VALTDGEKIKILRFMGWPAKTTDSTSLSYSKIISDRLSNLSDPILAETRYLLDRIEGLDDRLEAAITRAGVKRIDDIELSGNEFEVLRKEKNKLIRELGVLLDIAIIGGSSMPSQGCVVV
jgi:hypothetical protein